MQPKITYSYPIYHLLSRPQILKIQTCQNIPRYKFILNNVPHDQHQKSEYMHVKIRLKSIAQVAWEHGRNFHKMLLNKDYLTYTICLRSILNYQLLKPKTLWYLECNLPGLPDPHFITVIISLKNGLCILSKTQM